jgi:hypothetical protein
MTDSPFIRRLSIDQHQQDQRDHVLFPVRLLARGWGHPGYEWFGITDDSDTMCFRCVTKEYPLVVRSTIQHANDGWGIVGFSNTGDTDSLTICAHCNTVIVEEWEEN